MQNHKPERPKYRKMRLKISNLRRF